VEEAVTTGAEELGAIPREEIAGSLADASRVGEQAEALGAASALALENPSKAEEQRQGRLVASWMLQGPDRITGG